MYWITFLVVLFVLAIIYLRNKKRSSPKTHKNLAIGLRLATTTSMKAFLDRFPELKEVIQTSKNPTDDWDFFMVVAGVGIYHNQHSKNSVAQTDLIEQLTEIDPQMPLAFNDFNSFISKDKHDLLASAGLWVLWNIKGEAPSYKESSKLAPSIGKYLENIVKDFA